MPQPCVALQHGPCANTGRISGNGAPCGTGAPIQRRVPMTDIVIASAARTAIGSFNGAFNSVPAHDLGKVAIKGALERANVKPEEVDEVIMGQILGAAQGQNPARQAAVNSGIPVEKTALGINQLCG